MNESGFPPAKSLMFATTITGNGDDVVAVDEEDAEDEGDDDAEDVEEEDEEVVLALLLMAPWAVEIDVTVLVTVFVEPDAGGGAGGAVEGAKRLLATEAMPAVTNTAPRVMTTKRKWRRGLSF